MRLNHFSTCILLLCASLAGAQTASTPATPPPVKMGLWETTATSHIAGLQIPPDVAAQLKAMGRSLPGGTHTLVTQGCLTPEEWQKQMADMNKPAESDCKITNRHATPRNVSFDISCKSENGDTTKGHWEMQVVDDEHGRGSAHMTSSTAGPNGQNLTMDMTFNSHFLNASCGSVKPGDAKVIRRD